MHDQLKQNGNTPIDMVNMRKMTMKVKKKKSTSSEAPKKTKKTGKWKEGDDIWEP